MRSHSLPSRLAQARKTRGLTQAALATAAKVPHVTTLSAWERGENVPRADNLAALAIALDVGADWLLGLTDKGGPTKVALPTSRSACGAPAPSGRGTGARRTPTRRSSR